MAQGGTDVFKIFFSESFFIAFICMALSLTASFISCDYINGMLNEGVGATILSFGIPSVAAMLLSAFVTVFLSTFLPVSNAARKKPVDSIRSL